jgi:hypothetical protein
MKLTLFLLAFVVGATVASGRNYQTDSQRGGSSDGQSSSSRLASATNTRSKRSSTEDERKDEEHSVPTGGEHAARNHSHLEEEKAAIEGEKPSNTKRTKRSGRKAAGNEQKPSSAKERTRTKRSTAEDAGKGGEHSAATGEQSSSGQHRKELIVAKSRNQPIEGPTGEASKSKSSRQQTAKRKKRIATENKGKGGSSAQNNSGSPMSGSLGEKSSYAGVLDADHSVELYTVIENAKETNKTVGDAIDQYLSKQGFSAQKIKELNAQQAELEKKRATSA